MFKKEEPISPAKPMNVHTMIGEGTHFKGVLSFDGSVRIDGNLEGEINSKGTLIVGEKSVIQADIKVDSITIGGKIRGNITAGCRLVMLATADVNGKIEAPVLKIEEGAKFQGTSRTGKNIQDTKSISYNDDKTQVFKKVDLQVKETPIKKVA